MKKHTQYLLFTLFLIISLFFFNFLNATRAAEKEVLANRTFVAYTTTFVKGIMNGPLSTHDIYDVILENNTDSFNEIADHIKREFPFIKDTKIINKEFNGEFDYKILADDNHLLVEYGIFDNNSDLFLKNIVFLLVMDENIVIDKLGLDSNYSIIINNDTDEIYIVYNYPRLKFFQIVSSISIGLLSIFIYQTLSIYSIKNHYEVLGLYPLLNILTMKDHYTAKHSEGVSIIADKIARELHLPKSDRKKLYKASILHDIGKIGIPEYILNKPGKLTDEEFTLIKKHPVLSSEIVAEFPNLKEVAKIVLSHHEKIDGSGYPDGLKEDEIPFLSQILCVADIYNALTTVRPYRDELTIADALDIMKSMPLNQDLVLILKKLIKNNQI